MFVFVGDHVDAEGKFVDICTFATEVEDPNLRVWYTAVESRLGVRLVKSVEFFNDQRPVHSRKIKHQA